VTDLYDQDDEVTEVAFQVCPVCFEPWRDIKHFCYWRQVKVGEVMHPVLTCTRKQEMWK
jgi:hypothetical protein